MTGTALLTLVLLTGVIGALATDRRPTVARSEAIDAVDIERALQLIRRHDPRRQSPGVVRVVALQHRDLQLLLLQAAARLPGLAATIQLSTNAATLRASLPAPPPLADRWLNFEFELVRGQTLPEVRAWAVGRLPLPTWAAQPLLHEAVRRSLAPGDPSALFEVIRGVDFRNDHLLVFYAWRDDTSQRLRTALVPAEDQVRLRAYHDRLVAWATAQDASATRPLADLIAVLFDLARQRSSGGASALEENRAALLTLTLYATGARVSDLMPAAALWPQPRPITVTLSGREDLALHYLISATLATESGRPLAEAVGVYKEIADSRGGSGFSFTDLLADRAGTRLGQLALSDPMELQTRLIDVRADDDLLPALRGLPDGLSAVEFEQRFGGVGSPEYERLLADIDARLARTATLR